MLSARTFAVLYDLHLAAVWRGEEPTGAFGNWLEARWYVSDLTEPLSGPTAVSLLGGGGKGIRWYEVDGALIGFVRGRSRGCYVVASDDNPPPPAELLPMSDFSVLSETAI